MKRMVAITIFLSFSMPALAAKEDFCGASGSGCESNEYRQFLDIAATAFSDAASYEGSVAKI